MFVLYSYMQFSNGITYLKNKLCPQSRTLDDSTEFFPAQHMYDIELICRLSIHLVYQILCQWILFLICFRFSLEFPNGIHFTSISIVRFCRSQKLSDKNSLYFERSYD